MGKHKRDRKIQKRLQFADAGIKSPPYKTVSIPSNTKKIKKKHRKSRNLNICHCHDENQFKTWQSVESEDTTDIYDNSDERPLPFYKLQNSKVNEGNTNYSYKTARRKSQSVHSKINKDVKKSRSINRKGPKVEVSYLQNGSKRNKQPNIHLKVEKKSKMRNKKNSKDGKDIEDSCVGGPCKKIVTGYDIPKNKNYIKTKNKLDRKAIENNYGKERDFKAQGDQAASKNAEKVKSKSFVNNFINKLKCFSSTNNNMNVNNKNMNENQEPLFEIKVDSTEMQILNSTDIKKKVNQFGTLRHKQCICPSRMTALKNVCEGGICKEKQKQRGTRFNCKCQMPNNIECKDTTCDDKISKPNKVGKLFKSANYTNENNPLFEMRLDSNMAVINSHEIQDIFRNNGRHKICPTGICNTTAKKGNAHINCKCLNKKIVRKIMECTSRTCQLDKKSKYLENFVTPQQDKKTDLYCKCFCECDDESQRKRTRNLELSNQNKKSNKRRQKKCRRFRRKEPLTAKEQLEKCFQTECVNCKKKLKEKEHQYKKNEKKLKKKYIKEDKILKKARKKDEQNWNCLTNLVSGLLNLLIQTVKNVFTAIFSLITNPVGSYVYVRERTKDPPGTMSRIARWFIRTWTNRTSKLSQKVKESDAMNVIADQIEDSAVYESLFANKGRTKKEKSAFAKKSRLRKKRIRKRQDEALYGCQHVLLTTLRKTPCLWFYHICPDLYPQCLSLTAFIKNFFHLIIYMLALLCWTPCILSFELCRAFLCCLLCTG